MPTPIEAVLQRFRERFEGANANIEFISTKFIDYQVDFLTSELTTLISEVQEAEREKQHDWVMFQAIDKSHWYPACEKCGLIMSRNRKMKPCVGVVKMTLR